MRMRIKHRFVVDGKNSSVLEYLTGKGIEKEQLYLSTAFYLYEDDVSYNEIKGFLDYHGILHLPSTSQLVFSQDEIDNAKWLSVRSSWLNGYPHPKSDMGYRAFTFDDTGFCDKCLNGLVQKGSFILKKEQTWGRRNFFMLNWVHDELFASIKAANILESSNLTGFSFHDVIDESGDILKGTKQMCVDNCLESGLNSDSVKEVLTCEKCGFVKYLRKIGLLFYNKKAFADVNTDVIKTYEKFGEITCISMIFASQKFYKTITENNLDQDLVFEPVNLTD